MLHESVKKIIQIDKDDRVVANSKQMKLYCSQQIYIKNTFRIVLHIFSQVLQNTCSLKSIH